jgi:hypothetical protein
MERLTQQRPHWPRFVAETFRSHASAPMVMANGKTAVEGCEKLEWLCRKGGP